MIRQSPHANPHARAQELRHTFSQLIFAWGSVLSAAAYALLTLLGRPPLVDDHLTITALIMLGSYLISRVLLDIWLRRTLFHFRRGESEDGDRSI